MPSLFLLLVVFLFPHLATAEEKDQVEEIGFTEFKVTDPVSGGLVPVSLWYPAQKESKGFTNIGPFKIDGKLDALPKAGEHPLAVLSHGSGGSRLGHRDTAAALAHKGWIVAAPEHPYDNFRNLSGRGSAEVLEGRPKTLSVIIDFLTEDHPSLPKADKSRIAAIGFSTGGYAVLALAGARPEMERIKDHCEKFGHEDSGYCADTVQPLPKKPFGSLADPRVKAIVSVVPVTVPFSDASLRSLTLPIYAVGGDRDEILKPEYHIHRLIRLAHNIKSHIYPEAGHFTFLAPFPAELEGEYKELAVDPDGINRHNIHQSLNSSILAFLSRAVP